MDIMKKSNKYKFKKKSLYKEKHGISRKIKYFVEDYRTYFLLFFVALPISEVTLFGQESCILTYSLLYFILIAFLWQKAYNYLSNAIYILIKTKRHGIHLDFYQFDFLSCYLKDDSYLMHKRYTPNYSKESEIIWLMQYFEDKEDERLLELYREKEIKFLFQNQICTFIKFEHHPQNDFGRCGALYCKNTSNGEFYFKYSYDCLNHFILNILTEYADSKSKY